MTTSEREYTGLSTPDARTDSGPPIRRVALASLAGSVLEWYDFFLYGFAATLVFGPLFFPGVSATAGTLAALGTFVVGFVARPLGGILFGHLGDRVGRKQMLITTLLIMGIPSFLIGLLPTYASIGAAAPVALVLLRFFQGIGLGGEWGGAVLVVTESSPARTRAFWGSIVQVGAPIGQALATGVLFAVSWLLSEDDFLSWGWRIPFLLGIALSVVGLFIRLRVMESPEFVEVRRKDQISAFPLRDAIHDHWRSLLVCFGIYVGGVTVPFYVQTVFLSGYGIKTLGLDQSVVLLGVSGLHVTLFVVVTIVGGKLSDRFGAARLIRLGLVLLLVLPAIGLVLASGGTIVTLLVGIALIASPQWLVWGSAPTYFSDAFPTRVRYTGISFSGQAATIIGGLVPLVLTSAVAGSGGALWPVVVTTTAVAAFGLGCVMFPGVSRSL